MGSSTREVRRLLARGLRSGAPRIGNGDFVYKKDWCHDRLKSVTPKEGPSDRRYKDIILQCFPPE